MKKHIPNLITLANLSSGIVGILFAFEGNLVYAAIAIWIAALFDFFDGFFARMLKVTSAIGKELDSLADLISFGVLPGTILYHMLDGKVSSPVTLLPYLIVVFSALRLAKFNTDTDQTDTFIGLPTPAAAFFVSGLPFWMEQKPEWFNQPVVIIIAIVLSLLLVAPVRLLALKFKDFNFSNNWQRFLVLILSLVLLLLLQAKALPLIITLYILISVLLPNPKQQ
jgi:CDP-diacylglycerol--serine O-phosphatidyltransferase